MDQMPRSPLGARSGIDVTEIGLGLWAVAGSQWGPGDDTADVYGDGHSEELLGRAMRDRSDRFVVATKIG